MNERDLSVSRTDPTNQAPTPSSSEQSATDSLALPGDDVGEIRPSTLMEIGYAFANSQQMYFDRCSGNPCQPSAVCALGAICLAMTGNALSLSEEICDAVWNIRHSAIAKKLPIVVMNDDDKLPIPEIAARLRNAGL